MEREEGEGGRGRYKDEEVERREIGRKREISREGRRELKDEGEERGRSGEGVLEWRREER